MHADEILLGIMHGRNIDLPCLLSKLMTLEEVPELRWGGNRTSRAMVDHRSRTDVVHDGSNWHKGTNLQICRTEHLSTVFASEGSTHRSWQHAGDDELVPESKSSPPAAHQLTASRAQKIGEIKALIIDSCLSIAYNLSCHVTYA